MPGYPDAGVLEVEDAVRLRYAHWRNEHYLGNGTVLLLQGRSEYIEKQYETISDLLKLGFDVIAFDWRGHGGSSRVSTNSNIGYVDDFQDYVTDLNAILDQILLPEARAPFSIIAHSTGALVSLLAGPSLQNRIERMVFSAPFLGIGKQPIRPSSVRSLSGLLISIGLGETLMTGRNPQNSAKTVNDSNHTSDEIRFKRNRQFEAEFPELVVGGASAAWVHAACRAMDVVKDPDFHTETRVPILMITAGKDIIVDNRETEILSRQMRAAHLISIPGCRHEILQEHDYYRGQFFSAMASFLPAGNAKAKTVATDDQKSPTQPVMSVNAS
ncbi:MAG: alpha/beta hydrolase [Pseudomonadota bacterium]